MCILDIFPTSLKEDVIELKYTKKQENNDQRITLIFITPAEALKSYVFEYKNSYHITHISYN